MKRAGQPPHVYITHDTLRGIMLEKARHPGVECIIQMPGRRVGNDFYYDLAADSGIHAVYEYAMCEKDHIYCDHLSTRIAEYYDFPYEQLVVSQIHSHPAGCRNFSHGDGPANIKLARQYGGVTNGLMWVDPEFHMKFWYIDEDGKETDAEYTVDDRKVAEAMPKKSVSSIKKLVEEKEAGVMFRHVKPKKIMADQRREIIEERDICETKKFPILVSKLSDLCRKSKGKKEKNKMKKMTEIKNENGFFSLDNGGQLSFSDEGSNEFENVFENLRPYTVLIPEELKKAQYEGPLKGYYVKETKTFNVVPECFVKTRNDVETIGEACQMDTKLSEKEQKYPFLLLVWKNDEIDVTVMGDEDAEVHMDTYTMQKDVFSRNTGILEASQMADKQVVIAGAGSGGFFAGLELVKAGIGSVVIADDDVFAYHNICRHVCGIHDVGRLKVDIFKERAADINPYCKVYTFCDLIQHVDPDAFKEVLWKKSIILCCTDNRHAGYVCNEIADQYHIPMIDAGCGVRASTGEIFYYKPDEGMACYTCAYGEDVGIDHVNQSVRRKFYATEAELEKLHFQPGMSLDIEITAIFEVKLAIDLLMEGEKDYVPKILPYIHQVTVLVNYPVDKEINPYMQLFEQNGERVLPMTWKSGSVDKNSHCSYCKTSC